MKLALRYIPTEVWVDVFIYPWITRKQLGKIVHRFRNRKFVEILQYCLHDRGKRMLDTICLDKRTLSWIPRTPMPENIKFFKRIVIRHFDLKALDFLRRIRTLFIFNEVNLDLNHVWTYTTSLRPIFDHLAPQIHGIYSMSFDNDAIPFVEQYFAQKLAQVKMLKLGIDIGADEVDQATMQTAINFSLNWLTSEERDPAEPKILKFCILSENFQQFAMAVKQVIVVINKTERFLQQFLSAKRPCAFAIQLINDWGLEHTPFADFDLENNLGEQLHGECDEAGDVQILRHSVNFARTQLQEWVKEIAKKSDESSVIDISEVLTIGSIEANDDGNEVNEAGTEEDGPSTSKKREA